MFTKRIGILILALLLLAVTTAIKLPRHVLAPSSRKSGVPVRTAYGKLPLSFEANEGQTDQQVNYLARGKGYTLFLSPNEAVLSLAGRSSDWEKIPGLNRSMRGINGKSSAALRTAFHPTKKSKAEVVRFRIVGANPHSQVT